MRPGPKPRPNVLKVLHGETRPYRLNPHEPQIHAGEPEPPPGLSRLARPYWDHALEVLRGSRVLTPADRYVVADWAEHQASHDSWNEALRQAGPLIRGARSGDLVKNPLVSIIAREALVADRLRQQIGLSPTARAGLTTPAAAPDELEALLS